MAMVGSLAGPSTIAPNAPSDCKESTPRSKVSYVVVRNETADQISVTLPNGSTRVVAPHEWMSYPARVGASFKLSNGTCIVTRDEPTLAIVGNQ